MNKLLNGLVENYKNAIIQNTMRLVAKKSVNEGNSEAGAPFGCDIELCLEEALKLGRELGFKTQNYDGYVGTIDFGDRQQGREIGILGHLDVVPAGDGWTHAPFEPYVVGDRLFGRGTVDDKGPIVACMFALKAIKESKVAIKNHARLIMGTDEEGGQSRCVKYYLQKEKQPWGGFSPDGNFPVIHAEKGIIRYSISKSWEGTAGSTAIKLLSIRGGTKINIVPSTAEAILVADDTFAIEDKLHNFIKKDKIMLSHKDGLISLQAKGNSAHAMQPWLGESAINTLLDFLRTLDYGPIAVKNYLDKISLLLGDGYRGENMGISCEDKLSGILTHSMGILEVDGNGGKATVDLRYPIHADREMLIKTMKTTCADYGLTLDIYQNKPCLYVPKKDPLVQTLLNVYQDISGKKDEPVVIGGGTYCRSVQNFLAYGPVFPGQKEMAHEVNEFINISNLILSAKIYAQAIYELLNE